MSRQGRARKLPKNGGHLADMEQLCVANSHSRGNGWVVRLLLTNGQHSLLLVVIHPADTPPTDCMRDSQGKPLVRGSREAERLRAITPTRSRNSFDMAPRYLLRDGDGIYGERVRRRIDSLGVDEVVTAPASPWQNPYVERVIGSLRRELLDHVILNERHLRRLLSSYLGYYHLW